jgi:hypothetical protein
MKYAIVVQNVTERFAYEGTHFSVLAVKRYTF